MQTCVGLCVGQLCYVYRTMCKNIHNVVYFVLSTPSTLWHCLSHSFPFSELNKIHILYMYVSLMRPIVVYIIFRFLNLGLQNVYTSLEPSQFLPTQVKHD